ncbi:MAG: HsdM family class I SAM-dependent methyltransferase, partial [Thermoproteota archaeon]
MNSSSFVAEIKLGEEEKKLAKAVAQAWDYATQRGTRNVVALVFPGIKSGQPVLNIEEFKKQVLIQPVNGYVHTDYWEQWVESERLRNVLVELYKRFKERSRKVDFNSVVKAIRELVQDLYEVVRQANTDEIFEEVAKKLELFVGLGEIDKQKAKAQVSMLASYLLFNQLLFYHVYKVKTNDEKLEELKPIKSLNDLKRYFSKIESIDYQPIYAINLVDKIPEHPEILSLINYVIKNLTLIRAEYITQDLAGRFFHALLPKEVAKVWAAFYTNPIAAEILARLAIDRWDEKILDPACGSGTLLSACYRRKLELYEEQTKEKLSEEVVKRLHRKFLEEDITGIDIMPFAAHLTAINLATQKLEEPTNVVRVASMDSLDLVQKVSLPEFKSGNGILVEPFTGLIQSSLLPEKEKVKKLVERPRKPLSPSGVGKEFYLKPVDVIIMNPPFSDREKLPEDYLEKLSNKSIIGKTLGKTCGHQINLWGYFLALADLMLKPNGKIAVVVPINIARGKATEKIRNYLLENYHIKYIV